jgi:hypothetical protein
LAWQGLGLALLAPLYIAAGLGLRRVRAEFTWPLYSAGYALTAVGALLTFGDPALTLWTLVLDAAVYAASARLFRQPFWLYLSNLLVPVIGLLALDVNHRLNANWAAPMLMGLAFVYVAVAQVFERRGMSGTGLVTNFAVPFLAPAYGLSAIALAVATSNRVLAVVVFSAGVVLYGLSAWRYRQSLFLYPTAWLTAVPYFLTLMLLGLPRPLYGLAWLPLILGCLALGRLAFHRKPLRLWPPAALVEHPALPFYLLAYGLSMPMVLSTSRGLQPVALAAAAALYLGSAALYRRPAWIYPGLLAVHAALLSALALVPSKPDPALLSLPFHALTWVLAAAGYVFNARRGSAALPTPLASNDVVTRALNVLRAQTGPLWQSAWARPFFVFVLAGIAVWSYVADGSFVSGLVVAAGHALLLAILATLWLSSVLAYAGLGFVALFVTYVAYALVPEGVVVLAGLGGLGLALALAARLAALPRAPRAVQLWRQPLDHVGQALSVLSVAYVLPLVMTPTSAVTATLAFAGLHGLLVAYRQRSYRLGYGAVALLLAAWCLELAYGEVTQPQWYALPAGLYLAAVGYLERRVGRKPLALMVEGLGLAVLLLTSFIQSLRGGSAGVPFFLLLTVEALAVIAWGAVRRIKSPFFVGLLASVLNVIGQVVVLFAGGSGLIRWLIVGATGLIIVVLAIFVERQRERIIAVAQAWRETLVTWD